MQVGPLTFAVSIQDAAHAAAAKRRPGGQAGRPRPPAKPKRLARRHLHRRDRFLAARRQRRPPPPTSPRPSTAATRSPSPPSRTPRPPVAAAAKPSAPPTPPPRTSRHRSPATRSTSGESERRRTTKKPIGDETRTTRTSEDEDEAAEDEPRRRVHRRVEPVLRRQEGPEGPGQGRTRPADPNGDVQGHQRRRQRDPPQADGTPPGVQVLSRSRLIRLDTRGRSPLRCPSTIPRIASSPVLSAQEGLERLIERLEHLVVGQRPLLERLVDRPAGRRPRPDRGRPRPGQDPGRPGPGPGPRPAVPADPVHPRPAPRRPDRHPDLSARDRHVRRPPRPDRHQRPAGRRDQPGPGQGPERPAGGDAGGADHRRRRDDRPARDLLGPGHPEPDRARGDLSRSPRPSSTGS